MQENTILFSEDGAIAERSIRLIVFALKKAFFMVVLPFSCEQAAF
jgi:hypothetical protein